jgi:uncharacterized damage-inducible protein DinB
VVDPWGDRPRPPYVGDERAVLDGWLDFHRATLLLKCEGLSAEQLRTRAVPPSSLTLLGLVRHLTEVERSWFLRFLGTFDGHLYSSEDNPDADFDDVADADAAVDLARYRSEVDAIREAVRAHDLDEVRQNRGRELNLRWIVTHLIEEYARHNGHADLIREALDGSTGD